MTEKLEAALVHLVEVITLFLLVIVSIFVIKWMLP